MKVVVVNPSGQVNEIEFEKLLQESEKTILYFYPRDNTPGCTTEAKDFSEHKDVFAEKGIRIVGVSKDSDKSHCNFMEKQSLEIDLISDQDLLLHKKYGARGEKKNYGRVYEGTIRSSFLLDQDGEILQEWRNVKAKGHVSKVLEAL